MTPKAFSLLTVITTALAAAALFLLPYKAGVFPGGAFAEAAVGPLPLWVICSTLVVLLLSVCGGTALGWGRGSARR